MEQWVVPAMDLWGNVQFLWETTLKGKGNVPGGQETVGGIWGILAVWSQSAKFQLQFTATHVHGPPATSGPAVWHENGRTRTQAFKWVCPAPSTAF